MNTDIETTWGAAVYAHRINNGYVKYEEYDEDGNTTVKPIHLNPKSTQPHSRCETDAFLTFIIRKYI